jgi:hypothetical protein
MTPTELMERFPTMDLMMAETILHAEKSGLLDKIDLEEVGSNDVPKKEIVVTDGIVVTGTEGAVTTLGTGGSVTTSGRSSRFEAREEKSDD